MPLQIQETLKSLNETAQQLKQACQGISNFTNELCTKINNGNSYNSSYSGGESSKNMGRGTTPNDNHIYVMPQHLAPMSSTPNVNNSDMHKIILS